MEMFYSNIVPEALLHIVHRIHDINSIREDIVPPEEYIQMAAMDLPEGKTFKPHRHLFKEVNYPILPQESCVVIAGKIKCIFYDLDDTILAEPILNPGDCSITLQAGHNYIALEPSLVREFKVGPYRGQEKDKIFI